MADYVVSAGEPIEIDGLLRQPGEAIRVNVLDEAIDRLVGHRLFPPPPAPPPPRLAAGLYATTERHAYGLEILPAGVIVWREGGVEGDGYRRLDLRALLALEEASR